MITFETWIFRFLPMPIENRFLLWKVAKACEVQQELLDSLKPFQVILYYFGFHCYELRYPSALIPLEEERYERLKEDDTRSLSMNAPTFTKVSLSISLPTINLGSTNESSECSYKLEELLRIAWREALEWLQSPEPKQFPEANDEYEVEAVLRKRLIKIGRSLLSSEMERI
jgi:hypothetical protein